MVVDMADDVELAEVGQAGQAISAAMLVNSVHLETIVTLTLSSSLVQILGLPQNFRSVLTVCSICITQKGGRLFVLFHRPREVTARRSRAQCLARILLCWS
jgi:hypothetical protein